MIAPAAPGPARAVAPVARPAPDAAWAESGLRTLRDGWRWATSRLREADVAFGQGTLSAEDEAAWMLLWTLHLPPDRLDPWLDAAIEPVAARAFVRLVERRCTERVPAAYLLGEAWLRGLRFACDARALVPRSLIAQWLDEGAELFLDPPPGRILDLCTGGGSLAVLAALRHPQAQVTASDLSAQALALAEENLRLHGLHQAVRLVRGDLFEALGGERFDLILCNPPYVNAASMAALPPEFLAEPRGALAGGEDGMDFVRRLLAQATDHLLDGGRLVLEIGHEAPHFLAAFPRLECTFLPVADGEDQLVLIERTSLSA